MRHNSINLSILDISGAGSAASKNIRTDFKSKNPDEVLTYSHGLARTNIRSGTGRDVLTPSELPSNAISFCYSVPNNPDCDGLGTQSGNILDWYSFNDTYRTQLFTPYGSTNLHFRTQNGDNNGSWNPWCKIYHTGNKPIPIDLGAPTSFGLIDFGGSSGIWTTDEFINFIKSNILTSYSDRFGYWICKGSWSYGSNKTIGNASTGCGNIPLAGSVVEIFGSTGFFTIRITTPSTVPSPTGDGMDGKNSVFIYIDHGPSYAPGWRREYDTANPPTAYNVNAFPQGVVKTYDQNLVPWNAQSGVYTERFFNDQGAEQYKGILVHFYGDGGGSTPSVQFRAIYKNGGLFYRSSRDANGFERPFAKIYTSDDKPTVAEVIGLEDRLNNLATGGTDVNNKIATLTEKTKCVQSTGDISSPIYPTGSLRNCIKENRERQIRLIWEGAFGGGQTIGLGEDIRGRTIHLVPDGYGVSAGILIPMSGVPDFWWNYGDWSYRFIIQNNGTTISMPNVGSGSGAIRAIYVGEWNT